MPCLFLASSLLLLLWPAIRAGQWLAGSPWWICLLGPAILAGVLAALLEVALRLVRRYLEPKSPLWKRLALVEAWLDGTAYGWIKLPAGVLLGGVGALSLWQGGPGAASDAFPPLLLAWLALIDWSRPNPLPAEPLPVPLDDNAPPLPDSGKEVILRWAPSLDEKASLVTESLLVPNDEYEEFRERERHERRPLSNYALYVSRGLSPSIRRLARRLRRYTQENGLDALGEACCAVRLTREIPYESDTVTREVDDWADYPVELLFDERGDCEDHAILAAAILHYLGHRVALYWVDLEDSGHIALAYSHESLGDGHHLPSPEGDLFFYIETVPTTSGHGFGQLPPSFLAQLKASALITIPVGMG